MTEGLARASARRPWLVRGLRSALTLAAIVVVAMFFALEGEAEQVLANGFPEGHIALARPCTLIGCESGVTFDLRRAGARDSIEICAQRKCKRLPANGRDRLVHIRLAQRAHRRPVTVRVRLFSGSGRLRLERSLAVRLRPTRPNGPGCPPLCYQRSVRFVAGNLKVDD